jgi:hypothetical protein
MTAGPSIRQSIMPEQSQQETMLKNQKLLAYDDQVIPTLIKQATSKVTEGGDGG